MRNLRCLFNGICLLSPVLFASCAGTHGVVESYGYNHSKEEVEQAIYQLYQKYPKLKVPPKEELWQTGTPFFTFQLPDFQPPILYEIRFYGDENMWRRQKNYSELGIIYIQPSYGTTMKEATIPKSEKEKYTRLFEQRIKVKIDSLLLSRSIR